MPDIHIPRPCAIDQQALTPTADGWYCACCQHEVVDFTRLSKAEVLAYLAARPGQRVCARLAAPVRPVPRPPKGPRRWLLAGLALLGASGVAARAGLPPRLLPPAQLGQSQLVPVAVRGTVLDDSLGTPVAGAYVFVKGTRFGAVTDERGEFSFSVVPGGGLDRGGRLWLEISAGYFNFVPQTVVVTLNDTQPPAPLAIRLRSRTDRGFVKGKVKYVEPPVPPPGAGHR